MRRRIMRGGLEFAILLALTLLAIGVAILGYLGPVARWMTAS